MKIDSTITLSLIVAICGLTAPVITTWLNNRHQMKIKTMEEEQTKYIKNVQNVKDILSAYLAATSSCIAAADVVDLVGLLEYGKSYALALIYVDDSTAETMQTLNSYIYDRDFDSALNCLNSVITSVRQTIQKL